MEYMRIGKDKGVKLFAELDDSEVERIFRALGLKYDTKHSMIFGKYYEDKFMLDENVVGEIISRYVSSECGYHSIGLDTVIEALEGDITERNSLLKDLWENV